MIQLSLDFSFPPLQPEPDISSPPLTSWQEFLALPVIVLANAWVAMSGSGKHPCKICEKRKPCVLREGCLVFEAYQAGLGWRFGDYDLMEATPIALARNGEHYEGVRQ